MTRIELLKKFQEQEEKLREVRRLALMYPYLKLEIETILGESSDDVYYMKSST